MTRIALPVLLACLSLVSCTEARMSLRLEPGETIYIGENSRRLGISDIMVQTIALVNESAKALTFRELVLEASAGGEVLLTDRIPRGLYEPVWEAYYPYFADPEVQKAQDSILLLSRVLPEGIMISPSLTMPPGTAIIIRNRALVFSGYVRPDALRVRATAEDPTGRTVAADLNREIVKYEQKNDYLFPLRARWYLSSSSALRSHHRLRLGHEFALDLIKIGADGKSFRTTGTAPEDYYAFGEPIHAVADGTVVAVESNVPETEMPWPGEARNDFAERVLDAMWENDPSGRIAGGNYVVIEHDGGEHSVYVHMRHGSATVRTGDRVRAGQTIGEVGISGDAFEPHLHFGVMNGPSMSYAQGLPITFSNVRPVGFSSTIDMETARLFLAGEFVETFDATEPAE